MADVITHHSFSKNTSWNFSSHILDLPHIIKPVRAVAAIENTDELILIDNQQQLWQVNVQSAHCRLIKSLNELMSDSIIKIYISSCAQYIAISHRTFDPAYNKAWVIHTNSGDTALELKDHEYHFELADYPLAFIEINQQTCLIYASDWNSLDIINLQTHIVLTQRSNDDITDDMRKDCLFTEWSGELKISPNGKRIATIGWMWHPVGIAYSFDLENWIKHNKWEADFGKSKMQYGYWEYFWDSPFAWLDNERIIIWGDPETQQNKSDIPENNAVIYNAETGERLFSFNGPTMDIFEIDDDFLFSGNDTQNAISVWHWETGNLLTEYACKNTILAYIKSRKVFISINQENNIELIQWTIAEKL